MSTTIEFCPECSHPRCQNCHITQGRVECLGGTGSSIRTSPPLPRSTHTSPNLPSAEMSVMAQSPPMAPSPPGAPTSRMAQSPSSVQSPPSAQSPPVAGSSIFTHSSLLDIDWTSFDESSHYPRSISLFESQIASPISNDDNQKTPDNEDLSPLADDLKEAIKESSEVLVPVAPISKSSGGPTLVPAKTSDSSLLVVPDKSLGQTSHESDDSFAAEQFVTSIPMIKEVGTVLSIEDALPLSRKSKSDVEDTLPRTSSPLEYFAEDPTSYFDDISTLSGRVLNLHTDTLLRIQTNNGLSVLPLPNDSFSDLETSAMKHAWFQTSITNNIKIASAIKAGAELLADEGFCSFGYNIIVVDADRPNVLNVLPVSMPSLALLCDLLHELLSESRMGSSNMYMVMEDIRDLLLHIVSTLGLHASFGGGLLNAQRDSWPNICNILSSTLSILHLALLTFIRSHLDVIDVTPGGLLSSALQIETFNGKVLMAPRRLNCLNGLVKKPVWAFSSHPRNIDLSTVDLDGFYVSTSAEDFAQLWGPVKVEYRSSGTLHAASIQTRGGCLRQVSSIQSPVLIAPSGDETLCHWVSWLDVEDLPTLDNALPIDVNKRLLIGAYVTDESRRKRRKIPSMQLSDNCQCPDKYSFNYDAFELTTRPPSWKLDARTVQVSGGQYVTVNMGRTYKFDAGWTLKDVIVETWLDSEPTEPDPRFSYINPRYLDYLVVLDISCCSGNARRISLWMFLKHLNVRDFLRRNLNKDFFQDLDRTLDTLSSLDSIADTWLEMPPDTKGLLIPTLRFVLNILKSTGIRENKVLQVWDLTEVERVDGRKINPRWVSMLEDNDRCATFTIMTGTCMEYHPPPSRKCTGKTHIETVLCTQLCIKTRATIRGQSNPGSEQEKRPASGSEYFQKDSAKKFSSKWRVPPSSNLGTNVSVQPARDDQSHAENELLERLRGRQRSRQAVIQAVNIPSERMLVSDQDLPIGEAGFIPINRQFDGVTSAFEQQERCVQQSPLTSAPKTRNENVTDLNFTSGGGKTIGRLILDPSYGPKRVVNISRLSKESVLSARWEPYAYGHGLLNSIHEIEKAWDRRLGIGAQMSNGFVPRMFNFFVPHDDAADAPLVTEHIRLGTLKEGEKVVHSFIR
jgi:hypothetical protein